MNFSPEKRKDKNRTIGIESQECVTVKNTWRFLCSGQWISLLFTCFGDSVGAKLSTSPSLLLLSDKITFQEKDSIMFKARVSPTSTTTAERPMWAMLGAWWPHGSRACCPQSQGLWTLSSFAFHWFSWHLVAWQGHASTLSSALVVARETGNSHPLAPGLTLKLHLKSKCALFKRERLSLEI